MEEEKAQQIENPEKISIPDFKEYEIDRNGNVFRNGKLMKQQTNTYGYKHIHLCIGGKVTTCLVHRLVAMAFIPNRIVMNQERTLTFGKYKGTHRSNITGGFSAGDFGGLIYSIENFNESEYEF